MKKRLFALALCLALAVSLLPVTAFAIPTSDEFRSMFEGITYGGTYCEDTY